MPDPAKFVDRFEHQVAALEETIELLIGDPDVQVNPRLSALCSALLQVAPILKTQNQVNAMMLAAIDDLKKEIGV